MFGRHHRKVRILFAFIDVASVTVAFAAAYQTRLAIPLDHLFEIPPPWRVVLVAVAGLSWLLAASWLGLYERLHQSDAKSILRDTFQQCLIGLVSVILFQFSLRLDLSRPFLALWGFYSWVLLCLFRLHSERLVRGSAREFGKAHFILVVGSGPRAQNLARSISESARYGLRLAGMLSESEVDRLPDLLRHQVIDEVLFAIDGARLADLDEVFLLCDEEGVRTRVAVDFFPHANSEVYLDRLGQVPLLTFSAAPHDEFRLLVKRALDLVLAATALLVLAPLMLLIGLLIRLTSPGPAIFRQVRCGLNGRKFVFYKFRSMCENAEEMKASLEHLNRKQTAFKIPDDPRLTPIGAWLRRFSIDEWPQLWNVLKGDMSLVGPRPAVPEEVDRYQRWQRRRLRMRPGLTCLWAINGRDALDFETWMKLDMEYIDNWSLGLDWKILLRTIPHVVTGKGAH